MDQQTTIIVFHSFPKKPCLDGLMSAIIAVNLYQNTGSHIRVVPYWRTKESFEKLKNAVESVNTPRCRITYVDCTPDLEEEVDYLMEILPKIDEITVYDHHPKKTDSPIEKLLGKPNFSFFFDSDKCAAMMIYMLLSDDERVKLNVNNLLTIIQFSEYEGMNALVAGKDKADAISMYTFENVKSQVEDKTVLDDIEILSNEGMRLYFVLDQILANENDWKFLTDNGLTHEELYEKFYKQSKLYLETSRRIIAGQDLDAFAPDHIESYIQAIKDLPKIFSTGKIIKQQIVGDKVCDILVVNISIFDYGRCLEPLLVKALQEQKVPFAVLMNKPSRKPDGNLSYYFSLRRVSSDYDARDLAKFIKEFTGTKIGGGHPWASGASLNQKQYERFQTLL